MSSDVSTPPAGRGSPGIVPTAGWTQVTSGSYGCYAAPAERPARKWAQQDQRTLLCGFKSTFLRPFFQNSWSFRFNLSESDWTSWTNSRPSSQFWISTKTGAAEDRCLVPVSHPSPRHFGALWVPDSSERPKPRCASDGLYTSKQACVLKIFMFKSIPHFMAMVVAEWFIWESAIDSCRIPASWTCFVASSCVPRGSLKYLFSGAFGPENVTERLASNLENLELLGPVAPHAKLGAKLWDLNLYHHSANLI